jgi:hypothetical protein
VANRFRRPLGLLVRPQAVPAVVAVPADSVQVVIHRAPAAVPVEAAQVVLLEAPQVVPEAAIGRAASAARHAELAVVVVVVIKTNCNRSSPHTRLLMHPYQRASSSSSEACQRKSSLLNSIAPRLTSFGSC